MNARASSNPNPISKADDLPYKDLGKEFVAEFKDDDITGLGAEAAYHLLFAIPPFVVLIVIVAAILDKFTSIQVAQNLQDLVRERVTNQDAQGVLLTIIDNAIAQANGSLLSIGLLTTLLIALWSASNGVASLMKAFNRTYDIGEGRSFVKKRLVAVALAIMFAVFVNAAFFLSVFASNIGNWIAGWIGLGSLFTTIWPILSWILAVALFITMLAILYYFAPHVEHTFQWITPGAVIATILWVVALFGLQIYLTFANPGSMYGAFAGVIIFLFFLYVSSIILIVGAEVNAILETRYDEATVRYRVEHPDRLIDDQARLEAVQGAEAFDERHGTRITEKAPDVVTEHDQRRPVQRVAPRRSEPVRTAGGVSLAAVGVILGWLLGRREKEHEG